MVMYDLVVKNAVLVDGRKNMSTGGIDGRITLVEPTGTLLANQTIDAQGYLVSPPFVDSHFYLDFALNLDRLRINQSGTLLEGIQLWNKLKPDMTIEHIRHRADKLCH